MADKEDKTEIQAADVASLSIAEILGQLHENAADKCGAQSKGVKVTNSAIDVDGGKAKLSSSGEHIISVLPLKVGDPVEKNVAVEVLQSYVQWFVGPDLAKKINDSTVKSLLEAPGNEVKQKAESKKQFMSFKQFLNEAEDKDDGSNNSTVADVSFSDDGKDSKDDSPNNSTANDVSFGDGNEDGSADKKDDTKEAKENAELDKKKAGYYIPYSLKVEGLPQTALKDAVKKFAKTFFDDVKIYGSGLFGGSYSINVKDVKDAFRSAFGPIEPDDLVQQVETRIEKLYKGSGHPTVKIQDKDTLISDLGNQIDAAQKKKISDANYSLFIQVDEDDPKKPIFNPRVIADIVQSSITGLFKKFKNKITKNDVIYIPDYQDTHKDSQKVRDLYNSVPDNNQIYTLIDKADNAATAWSKIEDALDKKVKKNNQYKNCNRAVQCVKTWEDFKKAHAKETPETRAALRDNQKKEYFKSFLASYEKAFKDTQDKSIESTVNECILSPMKLNKIVLKLVLESFIGEADNDESKKTFTASAEQIKSKIKEVLKAYSFDKVFASNDAILVGTKKYIIDKLKYYSFDSATAFTNDSGNEFKNAVLATAKPYTLSESMLSNDSLKASIMDILFEDDAKNAKSNDNNNAENTKSPDEIARELKKAFIKAFEDEDINISSYANQVFIAKKSQLNESGLMTEGTDFSDADRTFNDKMIEIAKGGKTNTISIRPVVTVGTPDDVKAWLDKRGLADPSIEQKLKDYNGAAAIVLKIAKEIDGKLKGASIGFKNFTDENVVNALTKSVKDIEGTPELVSYEKTANSTFNYNKTKIPANCKVRVMFFNIKDDETTPSDTTPPTLANDDVAYVFPFGANADVEMPTSDDDKKEDDNVSSVGKQDAYVIPMKGLAYEDPEYATTNLK